MSIDPIDDGLGDATDAMGDPTNSVGNPMPNSNGSTGTVVDFSDDPTTFTVTPTGDGGYVITSSDGESDTELNFTDDEGSTFDQEILWNEAMANKVQMENVAITANNSAQAMGDASSAFGSNPYSVSHQQVLSGFAAVVGYFFAVVAQQGAVDPPRSDTGTVTVFVIPTFDLSPPSNSVNAVLNTFCQDCLLTARVLAMYTLACERYQVQLDLTCRV